MAFSDRLDRAIEEAQSDAMLSAQNRVEKSKSDQRVKMLERYADDAVDSLDKIMRMMKQPEVRDLPAVEAMLIQLKHMIVGLGNDGVMRRSLLATLATPTREVKGTRQAVQQQIDLQKIE